MDGLSVAGWVFNDQVAIFNTSSNDWMEVNVSGNIPSSRKSGAIFDSKRNRVVMFGGGTDLRTNYNDTWELILQPLDCTDGDGDGYYVEEGCGAEIDCDDDDPDVYPGAFEKCNQKDDDCDSQVDEDECQYLILSEDFEDNELDSRISIETVGSFNSNPGIKDISNFGSTKAFGYGRSTCGASCWASYVTNFKITFPESTYISTISFKEMELYGNWGSAGKIYIDGNRLSGGYDFGRLPYNDWQPDTTYREKSFSVDQYVTIIEIKVDDITSSSEIFIDDVKIYRKTGQPTIASIIWKEDFEDDTVGQSPSPHWSYTGNSDFKVNNSMSVQGKQSLRVHASPGGCWEAIPCRLLEASTSDGFTIDFYIYISSDHSQGCHPWTGGAGLTDQCNWRTNKGVGIIGFDYNGNISSRIGSLGTYSYDIWYKIKMKYERIDTSNVKLSYWIDGVSKGIKSVSAASYENDLKYLHFSTGDGTIWVDEIEVSRNVDTFEAFEKSCTESTLSEALQSKKASLDNGVVGGDLEGSISISNLEMVNVNSGSFSGKGFFQGKWTATLEGADYSGSWSGMSYYNNSERKIYLKGMIAGDMTGISEGSLTETVPDSGVYDLYQNSWRFNISGVGKTSGTLNLEGTLAYQGSTVEHPDTGLHVSQCEFAGTSAGDYEGPLDIMTTQVRIASQENPYNGKGFSILSYTSSTGTGDGYAFNQMDIPGVVDIKGMFTGPLASSFYGVIDENVSPKSFYGYRERLDLGSTPMADLKVKTWGPARVSPGQTVDYIIEYRNDGVKEAKDVILFYSLDPILKHLSASSGANHDEYFNSVDWYLGSIPPKTSVKLNIQTQIPWGLSQGTILANSAYILDVSITGMESQTQNNNPCSSNLYVNGINLKSVNEDGKIKPDPNTVYYKKCDKYAEENNATWAKVYYSGNPVKDAWQVQQATGNKATDYNGLGNDSIINGCYDTCYGYSGGTRTILSAIRFHNLKCNKVVLISPISGFKLLSRYKPEIEEILKSKDVEQITFWQSEKDKLIGELGDTLFQAKFYPDGGDKSWFDKEIEIETETSSVTKKIRDLVKVNDVTIRQDRNTYGVGHTDWLYYFNTQADIRKAFSGATATVATARDPNAKSVSPEGSVNPGETLTYTLDYENEGEGIAFGVYITDRV